MQTKLFSKRQILILASVWFAFLLSFIARLSWSTLMPIVDDALHFTSQQGTSYITAYYFGYALMVLPGGMVADKIGYKKTLILCLLSMAALTALLGTIDTYNSGLIIRFLLGVSSGPVHAACLSAIGDHFSVNQRGTAVGIYMTCTSFGISVINLYAPYVAVHYGWRMAFYVTALLPLLVLLLSTISMNSTKEEEHNTEIAIKTPVNSQKSGIIANLGTLVSDRNIILLCISGFFATGATWGVTSWANLYMVKSLGVSTIFAGSVMTIYGLAALIAKPTIGFLSDVLPIRKNWLAAICLFLFMPALLIFANTVNPNMLYITGPILGVGAFMYSALTNALVVQAAPDNLRGTTAGFVNLFNQIGSLSAPMLLGSILTATGSYQNALMTLAIFPVLGATALIFVKLHLAKK